MANRQAAQEAELIEEIAEAAEKIAAAIGPAGERVFRTDPIWALLKTIEGSRYCCSLSDIGRLMKISRQHARRLAFEAARAGLVDLARSDQDRRIVQLLLTKSGRGQLDRVRHGRRIWAAQLLLGLDTPRLLTATHVVRVIRQRLAQIERGRKPAAPSSRAKIAW
jgi:DNA-binding MarR family transcriptional regulator